MAGITVQELITQLKFKVDSTGIKQFVSFQENIKKKMQAIEDKANPTANALSKIGKRVAVNIDNSELGKTIKMAQTAGAKLAEVGKNRTTKASGNLTPNGGGLSTATIGAIAGVAGMAGGMALGAIMELPSKLLQTADISASIDGRLRSITNSTEERYALEQKIFDVAKASRGEYESSADLVFKLGRASNQTGLNMEQNLKVAETVNKALTIGGASTAETNATVLQLSQALGSGTLQGDELRSLNENASLLMAEVAKYFGTTTAGLKQMGADGKLTSDQIAQAILSASTKIDADFKKMPKTIGQSTTEMSNRWIEFVTKFERGSHAFEGIANGISNIGNAMFDGLIKSLEDGSFDARLSALTRTITSFTISLLAVKTAGFISGLGGMAGAVQKLTIAFKALNKSTVILIALTAVFYLIQDFIDWMKGDNTGIFGWLFGDYKNAMASVGSFIDGVKSTFSGLWESLKTASGNFLQWVQDRFDELGPMMATPFGLLLSLLQAIFPEAYYTIVNWMSNALDKVIQFFVVDIPTAVTNFVSFLGGSIASAVNLLVSGFGGGINTVKSFFTDLLNSALNVLSQIGNAISDFVTSKIEFAKNAISSLKNFVTGQSESTASNTTSNYNITQNNYGYSADGGAGGVWGY